MCAASLSLLCKMLESKRIHLLKVFIIVCLFHNDFVIGYSTSDQEWNSYKSFYGKDYTNSATSEAYARYYYSYNKNLIANHNAYYNLGLRSYALRVNQFSDMRFVTFSALYPVTTPLSVAFNSTLPLVDNVSDTSFNMTDLGFQSTIEDQGTACNSGWAYATVKSIEIMQAFQSGNMNPDPLSAQGLIDCAGRSSGCTNQVPQTGFDYLTRYNQELYLASEYPSDKTQTQQGMCVPPQTPSASASLRSYGFIKNGDDATMRKYVNAQYPVVIEFNPTSFEFMHYGEGIFQQPATYRGSHFMTVVGFGVNKTANLNYFIVQNSFSTTWGEGGLARIAYSRAQPLAKSAILPII